VDIFFFKRYLAYLKYLNSVVADIAM